MMFTYLDFFHSNSYDIEPLNKEKRLRVYENQLKEAVRANKAKWAKIWYLKTGERLRKRFNLNHNELSF